MWFYSNNSIAYQIILLYVFYTVLYYYHTSLSKNWEFLIADFIFCVLCSQSVKLIQNNWLSCLRCDIVPLLTSGAYWIILYCKTAQWNVSHMNILLWLIKDMAENNWPDERETKDVLDSGGYNTKDDNNAYRIRKLNLK
jgi:hypothetical protein